MVGIGPISMGGIEGTLRVLPLGPLLREGEDTGRLLTDPIILDNFTHWFSANLVMSTVALGALAVPIFALGFWDSVMAIILFNLLGCMVSLNDLADRPPRAVADDELFDLGGKRVRVIATPHVPHGWEAQVLYEETTSTLFCGDLFTHLGNGPPLTTGDIVGPAMIAEEAFHATSLGQATVPTIRRLAQLQPRRLALMHGSSFEGDAARELEKLADAYQALAA